MTITFDKKVSRKNIKRLNVVPFHVNVQGEESYVTIIGLIDTKPIDIDILAQHLAFSLGADVEISGFTGVKNESGETVVYYTMWDIIKNWVSKKLALS